MMDEYLYQDARLKPCPFCGEEPVLRTVFYDGSHAAAMQVLKGDPCFGVQLQMFGVRCPCCSAEIKDSAITKESAIERWNRRSKKRSAKLDD